MRGYAAAIKYAAGGQQKCAGAYRSHPSAMLGPLLYPGHQIDRACGLVNAPAPGDDQCVARRIACGQRGRDQRQPRRGLHGFELRGNHLHGVGQRLAHLASEVVGRGKHLQRPGHVEHLDIGKGKYIDDTRTVGHLA